MKLSYTALIFVLAILGCSLLGCEGLACTPSTCPPGAVIVDFPNADCTGEPEYRTIEGDVGVCQNGFIDEHTEEARISFYVYSDQVHCDRTAANSSYEYSFWMWGACLLNDKRRTEFASSDGGLLARSVRGAAFMFLQNVNDTFSPHAFDNQPIQAYSGATVNCESVDNCTMANGQPANAWITVYNGMHCQSPEYSYMPITDTNICTNYYNFSYAKNGCVGADSNAFFTGHYADSACTQLRFGGGARRTCSGSSNQVHCNAQPTPIPGFLAPPSDSPPASSASPLPYGAILIVLSHLAVIFM
jgi:hypothetical protein